LSQYFDENQSKDLDYFKPSERPYGKTFGQWTVDWWNWAFSVPRAVNPIYDDTGQFAHVNQHGPVWFLAGTFGENKIVRRTCTIPYGKAILFPIINYEINKIEKPGLRTKSDLINDVIEDINDIVKKDVIIDGELLPVYRIQADPPTFVLRIVEGLDADLPGGAIEAAADGYWIFLKPLSVGKHNIYFHGACSGGTRNSRAEYTVLVKSA
jgi:hypothetical protein